MKRIVSILLLTYPILVFADTLQFKDGRELEGSIIIIGKDYIVFKISDPNFVINSYENYVKEILDNQTIVFKLDYISIPEDFWGMGPSELRTQNEDESDEDFQTRVEEDAIARVEPIQNALLIHSGLLSSSRGFGMFAITKDVLFTENIGVYFSAGTFSPFRSTYGVGIFYQTHYNNNGLNIATHFGKAKIGGQHLTGWIYYQYRLSKRSLVSIGLHLGIWINQNKTTEFYDEYHNDTPWFVQTISSSPPSYIVPIISYDFIVW